MTPRTAVRVVAMVLAVGAAVSGCASSREVSDADEVVWSDEFDGAPGHPPDPNVWRAETGGGGWGNNELQEYTADAAVLDGDGHLRITATIPRDGSTPTSARLTTRGLASFEYGTIAARIRLPEGKGLLPAFWMMGDDLEQVGWPAAGEIDIVETPNSTDVSVRHVHGPSEDGTPKASVGDQLTHLHPLADDWHVYSVDREPGRIVLRVDGEVALETTDEDFPGRWVFDQPMHLLFSLAVGGNWPGAPDATTPETAVMEIDWVRVYKPAVLD